MPTLTGRPRQLTGTELLDWIALRRVHEGGVVRFDSGHVDHGRMVPCFLPEVFGRLAEAELTELRDPDFTGGPYRIVLTPCGRVRYHELDTQRGVSPGPDQANAVPWSVRPDRPCLPPVRGRSGFQTRDHWCTHNAEHLAPWMSR